MAGALKATTGLTGLAVSQTPHHTLTMLYGKIRRALDRLPSDYAYRRYTEEIIKQRESIVKNNSSVEEIEKQIDGGQVEELIIQANNELQLVRNMLEWKTWEPLIEEEPQHQWTWPPHK
ncbi:NADH dehydrogenase [ubiquinone] 1 alpha subcomplex subunit 5 [Orussus abietinus]|uniref:NADH dehydrogenase [ubiquinone] 1 alpha subcomplex subunit 5 n=1 Tax=Orussus abietinus TaxID=222816 RepID=UPI0006253959|nr:NADH dehydrogenase [ubiquinone] 1 alpha subcomplex subunit 5 [Orussus abietinus]